MPRSVIRTFLFIFCHGIGIAYSQKSVSDSIYKLIQSDKEDSNKVNHYNDLAKQIQNQFPDSALQIAVSAIELSEKINYKKGLANSFLNKGVAYYYLGNFNQAHDNFKKALPVIDEELLLKKDPTLIAIKTRILRNIGNAFIQQANYESALDYYFKVLKICEENNDKIGVERTQGNIGVVYANQTNYAKAREYHLKAFYTAQQLGDKIGMCTQLGNIGITYKETGKYLDALDYYFKSLKLCEEIDDKSGVARTYNNISITYASMNENQKALEYSLKALEVDLAMSNKDGMARDYSNLGSLYTNDKKYQLGFEYLYKALDLSKEIGSIDRVRDCYSYLSELYQSSTIPLKDSLNGTMLTFEQMRLRSLRYYKNHIAYRDSINSDRVKKLSMQKDMQYEFDKKESALVAEQTIERKVAAAESKKQKLFILLITIAALAILIIAFLVSRSLRLTKKQKSIIEAQKLIVEEKQKEVLDSIHYAKRIQKSLLPTEKYIDKNIKRLQKNK